MLIGLISPLEDKALFPPGIIIIVSCTVLTRLFQCRAFRRAELGLANGTFCVLLLLALTLITSPTDKKLQASKEESTSPMDETEWNLYGSLFKVCSINISHYLFAHLMGVPLEYLWNFDAPYVDSASFSGLGEDWTGHSVLSKWPYIHLHSYNFYSIFSTL